MWYDVMAYQAGRLSGALRCYRGAHRGVIRPGFPDYNSVRMFTLMSFDFSQ